MPKIVSIHQPNFMPWTPFFEKIAQSDVFVILGYCDFEKNNFQNRFQYNDSWHTLSVEKTRKHIVDKKYINPEFDWMKIKKRIHNRPLCMFDDLIQESVYQTNVGIIKRVCKLLDIDTEIVADFDTPLLRTERLVELCEAFGCETYLSGPSGKKYLELEKFLFRGIQVEFFEPTVKGHPFDSPAFLNLSI